MDKEIEIILKILIQLVPSFFLAMILTPINIKIMQKINQVNQAKEDRWSSRPVALMGDAAHAMYPTGSNGASQAIVDARVLGAAMLQEGMTPDALKLYDDLLCTKVSELVLRNRSAGPFGLLNILNERCGGIFENIDSVIPFEERNEFMSKYKMAAGFAIEGLNKAPPTIAPNAKLK